MDKNKVIKILETIKFKLELEEYIEATEYIELTLEELKKTKTTKEEKYINKLVKELK